MRHAGGCRCGNITVEFESAIDPGAIEVRACQCSFCRKHDSRAMTDPAGALRIRVGRQDLLERHTFGLKTAEYLICRGCGVYVSAITIGESEPRAIVVVDTLQDRHLFSREPIAVDYDAETEQVRRKRRRERWTPVTID